MDQRHSGHMRKQDRADHRSFCIGVSGHAVGETTEAVQALIGAASVFERGSFLVPLRHGELFRWCLSAGFRVTVPQTLMSHGFYQEPRGAFLPSVLY